MKSLLVILCIGLLFSNSGFKSKQLQYRRVQEAYQEKDEGIKSLLIQKDIDPENFEIYLQGFKAEKKLELWVRTKGIDTFSLVKTYRICRTSGQLGPKRKEGDLQIPEGFYHIDAFNPWSNFHLSLRINYPNQSDRILSDKTKPGGNICIHGACVTIGCLPLTDEYIKELYIYCVEAKNRGQNKIPVTIYPAKLSQVKYEELLAKNSNDLDKLNLWKDLKNASDLYRQTDRLPIVNFLPDGRHQIR